MEGTTLFRNIILIPIIPSFVIGYSTDKPDNSIDEKGKKDAIQSYSSFAAKTWK